MLTPTDKINIEKFNILNLNHQRVFRHRLTRKFQQFQHDLEIVLLNHEKLGIRINKIVDINQLTKLLELYEDLNKLQNM